MQQCLELAEQKLQQMLTEVVAELAQRVAALSKVLLLVPGGRARGGPVPLLSHHAPPRAAESTKECRHRGRSARLRWERSLSVRQSPLPCHPCVNFPAVLSCALCVPRMLQLQVTAAQSSVSNSKPSRIKEKNPILFKRWPE